MQPTQGPCLKIPGMHGLRRRSWGLTHSDMTKVTSSSRLTIDQAGITGSSPFATQFEAQKDRDFVYTHTC